MNKNKAQKDILYIAISFFVLTVLWIGFNLYHAHVDSTITPELAKQADYIDPTFNTEAIRKIKGRQRVDPLYELTASSGASLNPSPVPQQTPQAGNPERTASPSGSRERLGE